LEENLDNLLKIGEEGATVCREAPIFDKYPDPDDDSRLFSGRHLGLTITSTPQGPFMYWKGMEPSELLEYDSRLVAFTQELPFQEGKPLSPIAEEGEGRTVLVDSSSVSISNRRLVNFVIARLARMVCKKDMRVYTGSCRISLRPV
jgi:hypothetical protein